MTTEQLYEMMEKGNLGYACVFKKGDNGTLSGKRQLHQQPFDFEIRLFTQKLRSFLQGITAEFFVNPA